MTTLTPTTPATGLEVARDDLRGQLRIIVIAWVFGAFWQWTISGAALFKFARLMGTPDWGFGLLAALPFAAGLFQIPMSLAQARWGRRKLLFILSVTLGRLMWAVIAAIPWALPNHRDWWWPTMALCAFLGWGANSAGSPPWMDWMADVIPGRVRGRYFGMRNRLGQCIGLVATLSVGGVVYLVERSGKPEQMLQVCSCILALAGLMGALDILCFRRIPDHHEQHPHRHAKGSTASAFFAPLKQPSFRRYLAFNFVLNTGIGFIGQYIWVYVNDVLHFSAWQGNLLLIGIPLIMMALSYPVWGKLTDRLGKRPVILIAGAVIVNGAWGWIFVGHGAVPVTVMGWNFSAMTVLGYSVAVLGMICWPGVEIANFNMLLGMTGSHTGRAGGAYVAWYAIAVALGGALSGLIAGTVAHLIPTFAWDIPFVGIVLTYHGVLFLISTSLRILALYFAWGLREPKATGTREAFRYMSNNFYDNARAMLLLPTQVVGRLGRATYRLAPGRKPRK
ncbi:MAG: MFS transporter [Planctomycetota bacterium]|nr:MFS transporter [Planctomycetota bacterium]